jgi:hypothetical protein
LRPEQDLFFFIFRYRTAPFESVQYALVGHRSSGLSIRSSRSSQGKSESVYFASWENMLSNDVIATIGGVFKSASCLIALDT